MLVNIHCNKSTIYMLVWRFVYRHIYSLSSFIRSEPAYGYWTFIVVWHVQGEMNHPQHTQQLPTS